MNQFWWLLVGLFPALTLAGGARAWGQPIAINPGVDTTDREAKAAVTLWINYLRSQPDEHNLKNSPFWAESERAQYPKVDQLLHAINTETSTYAMGYPTILYVKPRGGFTEIKTLFSWADSTQNTYALCIASVFAKKENGAYQLYNALTVNRRDWQAQTLGEVTFHFPPGRTLDRARAALLRQSIDRLVHEWQLPRQPIDYYFADTYEEVQRLRGLDYAIGMGNADRPSGMADLATRTVFCGGLGEDYFHEVVHLYLNPLFPSSPLLEGLAVFYGGSLGHDLGWHLRRLDAHLAQHPEIDLDKWENFWYLDNFTNPNSAIQGLLCHLAYQQGGLAKLKKLMSYQSVNQAITQEFGVKPGGLNPFFREQIKLLKE